MIRAQLFFDAIQSLNLVDPFQSFASNVVDVRLTLFDGVVVHSWVVAHRHVVLRKKSRCLEVLEETTLRFVIQRLDNNEVDCDT